ncbi:hypothetical protein L486_03026 [Kwoniella mangroviensis CBS 10435]|uniref:Xylose isomerase-like TIM barrel domain-containing protein n=1 Tax=Kwoniella mangroviensis CBS 10435 TaxID=1331196 RepID=A0A1B9IY34_9TREE|nr:hypothetical protein L486_03026 [Kwoniella mangroviensis CBS 10435]
MTSSQVPITPQELDAIPIGYATPSLGLNPAHSLEMKFDAMAQNGWKNVELGFGNYVAWVQSQVDLPPSTCPEEWKVDDEPSPSDHEIWDALYSHAPKLKSLAETHGLRLLMLQPLNQFDGWPKGHEREEWVKEKAKKWIELCKKLRVEYLQVGANDQPDASGGDDKTAQDLAWLADIAQPIKIAYEPWCFSPRYPTWERCLEIVKKGARPNLGICLDTAQMALSPTYGYDPLSSTPPSPSNFEELIKRIKDIPKEFIFYLEISDVLPPNPALLDGSPFDEWHKSQGPNNPTRSTWVLCARALPYIGRSAGKGVRDDKKDLDLGVARVGEVTKAVFSTGFRGPVIWEPFEALVMESEDKDVPELYAHAGKVSKEKLWEEVLSE